MMNGNSPEKDKCPRKPTASSWPEGNSTWPNKARTQGTGGILAESMLTRKPNQYLGVSKASFKQVRTYEEQAEEARSSKATLESAGLWDQRNWVMPVEGAAHKTETGLGTQPQDKELDQRLETKLNRITEKAKRCPLEKCNPLCHFINEEHLKRCFSENLEHNLCPFHIILIISFQICLI